MTAHALCLHRMFVARKTGQPADRGVQAPCAIRALARDSCLHLPFPLGRTVHCVGGIVWLTFDGDPRDVVLHAGQKHRCDRDSSLTLQALDDACLRLE